MAEQTVTFNYTGGWQKFNVPNGVTTLSVTILGAGSGTKDGGRVVGKLRVKDKNVLHILVAQRGRDTNTSNGGGFATGGGGKGGDGGAAGRLGGDGGGGATEIRLNSNEGKILAVAGGAGGTSGDGGVGGAGGGQRGASGHRLDASGNTADGGGQGKGGNGGTIGSSPNFNGENASDAVSGRGGDGGTAGNNKAIGGGGGGGGYRAGGGGQAGKFGVWYGGGGGGGSSFVDELYDVTVNDRDGGTGHGSVTITYQEFGDYPPSTPTDVKINGADPEDDFTLGNYSVDISGVPDDPTKDQQVRILLVLSQVNILAGDIGERVWALPISLHGGTWDAQEKRDHIQLGGLQPNTHYFGRVYSQDARGQRSNSYVGINFWTNRSPDAPVIIDPEDATEFESGDTIDFNWSHSDPDDGGGYTDAPSGWGFRWRIAPTADNPGGGPWNQSTYDGYSGGPTYAASTFPFGHFLEWQAIVRDSGGLWGTWSEGLTFKVNPIALPPIPIAPTNGTAVVVSEPTTFWFNFRTEVAGETQDGADLRYRTVGADDDSWQTIFGDEVTPGAQGRWTIGADTFLGGTNYEWQVRTHTTTDTVSAWSNSSTFWGIDPPGLANDPLPLDLTRAQGVLGRGHNRVYVYKRGGQVLLGEITPLVQVQWGRKRDDMGSCTIQVNQWDREKRAFYKSLRSWAHELVVYRDGVRVFEGPITRKSGSKLNLEIEAHDVMAYLYRRLLRQGYNDSYQINSGQQVGLKTVVRRSQQIILNALAYDDPNVLPYLTAIHNYGDAVQSRVVKAYSKTAYAEVDDMAANAGLDYSVAGRRIILNDVHRPIGRLPEMRDGDFSDPPVVTEYGMSYATDFAVTNNNGLYGMALRRGPDWEETGSVEMIASPYGESDAAGAGQDTLTPAEISAIQANLSGQAERNISGRYPMPIVVRVPDNTTLNPELNIGINQLIPGVWIPLRATEGIVEASQWQKLDSMNVVETAEESEKISVVMSPAPNAGADPDADISEEG